MLFGQDDSHHRRCLGHWRALAGTGPANWRRCHWRRHAEPAGHQGVFVKADISSKAGVDDLVARLPRRIDCALQRRRALRQHRGGGDARVNFYGLRALSEALAKTSRGGAIVNVASIAGYG